MLSVSPQRIAGLLTGADRLHLVAPFETDPTRWYDMEWTDIYTGHSYRITATIYPTKPDQIPVNPLKRVVDGWATNPEPKNLGPDGQVCGRDTTGLLGRRPIRTTPELVTLIGKETNHLEEAQAGLMSRGEVLNEYPDPERDIWQRLVLPVIRRLGPIRVAEASGLDRRTVERLVRGTSPKPNTRTTITEALRKLTAAEPRSSLDVTLAAYLEETDELKCLACRTRLVNRRRDTRFCSNRCRMRYVRRLSKSADE